MRDLYVVKYSDTLDVLTEEELKNFLNTAVMHNKDITTFSVTNLRTHTIPIKDIQSVCATAYKKGIILNGGTLSAPDFNSMILYED